MKILDIAFKDLLRSFRSLFAVGMMFVAPILITALIYFAFSGLSGGTSDLPAVTVAIVNADVPPDNAPDGLNIGENIRSMFFDESVKSWLTATDYADEASARAAVDAQQAGVAVIIPANLTESALTGESSPEIVIVHDPTLSVTPLIVRNMVESLMDGVSGGGIAYKTIQARMEENGKRLNPADIPALMERYSAWYMDFQRNLFHHPDQAVLVMVAPAGNVKGQADQMAKMMGSIFAGQMIFFAFYTGAYSMMSILHEQEEGTLARIFSTPTRRSVILGGKFLAVFLMVLAQGVVLMAVSRLVFKVDWGQPASIALALTAQVIAAAGLGVMLISFVKTSSQAGPVLGGGLTALAMLSGLFTAGIAMPEAFASLAKFSPMGWVMQGWELSMQGAGPLAVVIPFAVAVGMGVIMFVIGALRFQKRFA